MEIIFRVWRGRQADGGRMRKFHRRTWIIPFLVFLLELSMTAGFAAPSYAANGSVTYTYDALGRVLTVSYDNGVIILYTYDANGNRTQQVINVNTKPLCLGTSAHGNPTTWGNGLWSNSGAGC